MGIAEGLLRIMPGWEPTIFGHPLSLNVMLPGQVGPFIIFGSILAYPFIESWITGDKREHHLLQRPRNAPTRTAFLVALMTAYGLLWAAGGNDILATQFHLNLNWITYFMRVAVFVLPVVAFFITRRWCISLQRHDNEKVLHGYETGIIMRSADGAYSERHEALGSDEAYTLTARDRDEVYVPADGEDANGISSKQARSDRRRGKLSKKMFGNNVQKPTAQELEEAHHHGHDDAALIGHDAGQH